MNKSKLQKRIKKLNKELEFFKRIENLVNSKTLYQEYKIRPNEKKILSEFVKVGALKTSEKVGVNRSYVYAVLKKFEKIYSKEDLKNA